MAVIEAKDVTKEFGVVKALDGVSIEVRKGDFFGFFGPNGAGKTTLLRILTGQLEPTEGSVEVLGIDALKDPIKVKDSVGIVPEVESPPSYLTGYEYLYFVGRIRKLNDLEDRIDKWLTFFDLASKKGVICKDLSKGMRQKLMIASAFIHDPQLVFLDEPFINLDPVYQKLVREYLQGYAGSGGTVFMCSHILEISEKLCNRIAIVDDGRVVADGSKDELVKGGENLEEFFLRSIGGGRKRGR
ncbi:MAG: ABC transporter ATP-binding protein [Methanobacteriota archaeon]|nr:MAG: ABC transporter ATP-binding protein [Euryarchaeota archaeon]